MDNQLIFLTDVIKLQAETIAAYKNISKITNLLENITLQLQQLREEKKSSELAAEKEDKL